MRCVLARACKAICLFVFKFFFHLVVYSTLVILLHRARCCCYLYLIWCRAFHLLLCSPLFPAVALHTLTITLVRVSLFMYFPLSCLALWGVAVAGEKWRGVKAREGEGEGTCQKYNNLRTCGFDKFSPILSLSLFFVFLVRGFFP